MGSVSLRPPTHWFFTVEEPTRSSPPRTAVHRSSFLSRSQPPLPHSLSLSSLITNTRPSPLFLSYHSVQPFSLAHPLPRSSRFCLASSTRLARLFLLDGFRQNGTHARGAAVVKATALHGMPLTYTLYHHRHLLGADPSCRPFVVDHLATSAINNLGQVKRDVSADRCSSSKPEEERRKDVVYNS